MEAGSLIESLPDFFDRPAAMVKRQRTSAAADDAGPGGQLTLADAGDTNAYDSHIVFQIGSILPGNLKTVRIAVGAGRRLKSADIGITVFEAYKHLDDEGQAVRLFSTSGCSRVSGKESIVTDLGDPDLLRDSFLEWDPRSFCLITG